MIKHYVMIFPSEVPGKSVLLINMPWLSVFVSKSLSHTVWKIYAPAKAWAIHVSRVVSLTLVTGKPPQTRIYWSSVNMVITRSVDTCQWEICHRVTLLSCWEVRLPVLPTHRRPDERKQRSMFCWTQISVLCAQIRYQCLTVQSACSLIVVRLSRINWILIASVAGFVPRICSQPTMVAQSLCLTGCAFADKLFAYCIYESDFTAATYSWPGGLSHSPTRLWLVKGTISRLSLLVVKLHIMTWHNVNLHLFILLFMVILYFKQVNKILPF